jgi:hypothetical protein
LDWYGIRPTAFAQGGEGGEVNDKTLEDSTKIITIYRTGLHTKSGHSPIVGFWQLDRLFWQSKNQ